jgi:hypothetical protein
MQIWRHPPRHKSGSSRTVPAEIFSPPREPPHLVYKRSRRPLPAVLTRARSRSCTRDTPAPRRDRALPSAPRRATHLRVPTSPTPLQRPRRLCRLDAHAFSVATVCDDDELPQRTPSPSLRDAVAALLAYKRSEAVMSPIISPSTPSRFAPLAEPLLTSPAHSRDEAPTVDPLSSSCSAPR